MSTPLKFQGIDGAECEAFINAIRSKAYEEGKDEDPRWMARYAATCFIGSALRWHIKLDKEIRNDWALLEDALIDKYPPVEEEISSEETRVTHTSTALVPTPPTVAPPPAPTPQKLDPLNSPPIDRVYRIGFTRGSETLFLRRNPPNDELIADHFAIGATCDNVKLEPRVNSLYALRLVELNPIRYLSAVDISPTQLRIGYSSSVAPVWRMTADGGLSVLSKAHEA
ncbi:hypothetical protein FRB99_002922, partial [Tulasnella sp. 403]